MQALAKDLPWKLKESRVLEILQAVCFSIHFPEVLNFHSLFVFFNASSFAFRSYICFSDVLLIWLLCCFAYLAPLLLCCR